MASTVARPGTRRWLRVFGLLAAVVGSTLGLSTPATAGTVLCDQFATTTIQDGAYFVQNNRWGTLEPQCVGVGGTGFSVTREDGSNPAAGKPLGYPSVVWGCHYGICTKGFTPVRISSAAFAAVRTSATLTHPRTGRWAAGYDLWFDSAARTDGQNNAEIMVWINRSGAIRPDGSRIATVDLGGAVWEVWKAKAPWSSLFYVRVSGTSRVSFSPSMFHADAVARGYLPDARYLTSVQAGFEIWSGGAGLGVSHFSVSDSAPRPGQGSGHHAVSRAEATVRNAGAALTDGWKAAWNWLGHRMMRRLWTATASPPGAS